jgi:hypothetical protein
MYVISLSVWTSGGVSSFIGSFHTLSIWPGAVNGREQYAIKATEPSVLTSPTNLHGISQ